MKNHLFLKVLCVMISLLLFFPILGINISARDGQAISVYIDGEKFEGRSMLQNATTYVGIRDFSLSMGANDIQWDTGTKTATVKSDGLKISSRNGLSYIIANGRYLWANSGIIIISGTMYVPLRTIAKAFNSTVTWNQKTFSAYVKKGKGKLKSGSQYYDKDEVYWLSRIINAEAGIEPFYGKIAVGTVVLNRVRSAQYPDTIYGVVFDRKFGVQFTPASNGTVYNEPNTDSIVAAKLCLDGASFSDNALFFVNDKIAESSWVHDNRQFITAIGNHNFYA